MRRLRWSGTASRIPAHPYRDSAVFYALLSAGVVGFTALTGGHLGLALILAPFLFLATTSYSWWRWRVRIREEAKNK